MSESSLYRWLTLTRLGSVYWTGAGVSALGIHLRPQTVIGLRPIVAEYDFPETDHDWRDSAEETRVLTRRLSTVGDEKLVSEMAAAEQRLPPSVQEEGKARLWIELLAGAVSHRAEAAEVPALPLDVWSKIDRALRSIHEQARIGEPVRDAWLDEYELERPEDDLEETLDGAVQYANWLRFRDSVNLDAGGRETLVHWARRTAKELDPSISERDIGW